MQAARSRTSFIHFSRLNFRVFPFRTYSTSPNQATDIGQPTSSTHPHLLKEGEITPGITSDEYVFRRKKLLDLLPPNSLAIMASAPVKMMTHMVPYTFRQDADYLYYTGCQQPGGVAVISEDIGFCMFMPDPKSDEVTWQGHVAGVEAALSAFKAEHAYPISKIKEILSPVIGKSSKVFHSSNTANSTYKNLDVFSKASRIGNVKEISHYTHKARWVKSHAEQMLMRESASIACQSLLQTMLLSRTSPDESLLSAKVEFECRMRGAQRMAFNPVVGGGANASVIHYSRNDRRVKAGDLLLMDIGCELHGYLSDLTRTWSPYGVFSSAQEELYDLILETNKECLNLCGPGVSIRQIHLQSIEMLMKGLVKLGIIKDGPNNLQFYHELNPTSIGHYLGMDVHDCAKISADRPLEPGVVITIEPGLYIPLSSNVPERYEGIGIRIEDEVLITKTGYEVLTGSMPKEIQHLKSLINYASNDCPTTEAATAEAVC